MVRIDADTLSITCPRGDTGKLSVTIEGIDVLQTQSAKFAICTERYTNILQKDIAVVGKVATIVLTKKDTKELPIGSWHWDVRVVSFAEKNPDGTGVVDELTNEVHSLFASKDGGLPLFVVVGVAANV